jgi:hypothetical protein
MFEMKDLDARVSKPMSPASSSIQVPRFKPRGNTMDP